MKTIFLLFAFVVSIFSAVPAVAQSDTAALQNTSLVREIGSFDFENPAEKVVEFRFLDNDTKLWMIGTNTLQLWDVRERKVLSSVRHGMEELSPETLKAISPDNSKLFYGRRKRSYYGDYLSVYVIDVKTLKRVREFEPKPFTTGEWSKDGKTFCTISEGEKPDPKKDTKNSIVSFWDGETLEPRKTITVPDLEWWYLTPDGKYFYTSSVPSKKWLFGIPYNNGMATMISIWNTATGQVEKNLSVGGEDFAVLTWKLIPSPSGRYLAMVSKHRSNDEEHKLLFWELDGSESPRYTLKANPRIRDSFIRFTPDEELFAIDAGKSVQIYHTATGEKKGEIIESSLPDHWTRNNQIALKSNPAMLIAYNVSNGEPIYKNPLVYETYTSTDTNFDGTQNSETVVTDSTDVVPNPDGNSFLTHSNQFLKLYKSQNGELIETVLRPPFSLVKQKYAIREKRYIHDAGWTKNGKIIYLLNYDRNIITLWDYNG